MIFKYRVYYYSSYFIPLRPLAGFEPNLNATGEFGLCNYKAGWFRDGRPFGENGGYVYELAFEATQNRVRIWLNGVLQRVYYRSWGLDRTFGFGDPQHSLQMSVNDILITDALFLPNGNYTVDWDNAWYDKFSWYLYSHDKEALAIPKKEG